MPRVTLVLLAALLAPSAGAQAPMIEKIDPPSWWLRSTVNPVRVMVRGRHLAGARLECGRLTCADLKVNAAGTYLFADVTVPTDAAIGAHPITVRTGAGAATASFELFTKRPAAGRYQGFDANDVIYLLMPDRFANGDPSNDDPAKSKGLLDRAKPRFYHGGDLAGVRQRLPYLKSLGVTAIWMNPIFDNNDGLNHKEVYDGQPMADYHGYGATDFYAVDEHLGDLDEFRRLVDDAHAVGIKVIADMVANHTGPYHPWVKDTPTATWYNGTEARHLANTWQTWTLADPYATADGRRATLDGWFIDILPDLNQGDPEVARYIIQNTLWWVAVSGMDGIRQDTWPYVPRSFWKPWMAAIKKEFPTLKVVGEVYDGDPAMVAFFQGGVAQWDGLDTGVDALFDFPLFYPIRSAFAEGGQLRNLAQALSKDRLYRDPQSLVTFLGLHDVGRFMGDRRATIAGLKLAHTFLLTTRGTPLLYYGDEIALRGGGDPDNRRDFPGGWSTDGNNAFDANGRTAEQREVFDHVQRLLTIRAGRADLRGVATENLLVAEQLWVYRRGATVVALNNDTTAATARIPIAALGADLLGACGPAQPSGGAVEVRIPARSGCIMPVAR